MRQSQLPRRPSKRLRLVLKRRWPQPGVMVRGDVSFRKSRQPYLEGRPGYLGVVRGFRRLAEVRKKRTIDTDGPDLQGGALVVPVWGVDGFITNLQAVSSRRLFADRERMSVASLISRSHAE
jgi:hypothetical protein